MRLAGLLVVCLSFLAVTASASTADKRATAGKLEVTEARGKIVLNGTGALVGRLESGYLEIRDLTPADRFSPLVGGVPRGKVVKLRGKDVRFRVPTGRYRIVVRGEGISLSAVGTGVAVLDGEPDTVGATGTYEVDDQAATAVPDTPTRVPFGKLPDDPSTDPKTTGGATGGGTRSTP